ncbi:Dolichyl-phosphate-mannose-protein mannosyltransferase [Candidatus Nitrotoga sp. HW29]|nr:Dolichyl-phosphate-mannose-protein mannosyltransferase [Candidatus Nitrotoga sp. HW29]
MTLLLAHVFGLLFVTGVFAFRLYQHSIDRALAIAITSWANIVVTGLSLSATHRLGEPLLFVRVSMLLAFLTLLLGYLFMRQGPNPSQQQQVIAGEVNWLPVIAFALTILPLVVANLLIALAYPLNNYDSLTYHLPRVMFYLGQGSLAHFETGNMRQIFFPFNLSLLHLAVLQHGVIFEKLLTLLNIGFWLGAGAAIYRICRLASYSVNASLAAAWLALTSTEILAQATATTNDLPTAASLLMAAVFMQKWIQTRQPSDALMSGLALGLAFGTKLTAVFFIPPAVVIVGLFVYRFRTSMSRHDWALQARAWVIPIVIFVILAAPFAVYNIKATGHWMTDQFDFTLNKPFSFGVFWQTTEAYTLQFFLEPLQRFTFDLSVTETLNRLAETFLFPNWNPAYAFSPLYLFPPDLNEDHVWFGFAGAFVITSALACVLRDRKHMTVITCLTILGLGWLLSYFALNKWSLYIQRYFVLPFLLMVPCTAYYFDKTSAWRMPRNMTRIAVIALFVTAFWFSISYLMQNTARPLLPLVFNSIPKPQKFAVPDELSAALSSHARINMSLAGGNERIFPLMRVSAGKIFTSASDIKKDAFNLISKWAFTKNAVYHNIAGVQAAKESHMLLPLLSKRTAGIEALGTIGKDMNAFAYFGLAPHAGQLAASPQNSNILVTLKYRRNEPERFMDSRMQLLGLNPEDGLEATILAEYPDGHKVSLAQVRDASEMMLPIKSSATRLVIELHDLASGLLVARGEIPFGYLKAKTPDLADDPNNVFSLDFIGKGTTSDNYVAGLAPHEGPYAQLSLPLFRWAKHQSVRIVSSAHDELKLIRLTFSARLQVRDNAELELLHNNKRVKLYHLTGKTAWLDDTVDMPAAPGGNIIELRDTLADIRPDWSAYLSSNPDVLRWVKAQGLAPELGAEQHFDRIGRKEGKVLPLKKMAGIKNVPPESLFFVFRTLQLVGRKETP